ncbi:MAG: RodZ domain-containing protein [Bacteriovoracaceae bacterium]
MDQNLTIGRLLKKTRESKSISLEDVANKTKININILKSLENDDFKALPNKTYVKGFVKNYAKTVGLDDDEAMEAFENAYKDTEGPNTAEEQAQELVHPKEKELEIGEIQDRLKGIFGGVLNKKVFIGVAVVALLALVGKGAVSFFSNISNEKAPLTNQSEADHKERLNEIEAVSVNDIKPENADLFDLENSKKMAAENAAKANKEDPAQELAAEAKPANAAKEDKAEEKKEEVLPAGKLPYVNFYPAPRNLFRLSKEAPELDNSAIFPKNIQSAMDSDKENLFIHATDGDTWLSYQVDGEDVKRFVLKQGKTLFLQGDEVILLFMGNLNAAKIFYNNQLVEAQSRTGVKSLIFPESKAAEHDFPLFPSHKGIPYRQDIYKKNMVEKPAS